MDEPEYRYYRFELPDELAQVFFWGRDTLDFRKLLSFQGKTIYVARRTIYNFQSFSSDLRGTELFRTDIAEFETGEEISPNLYQ